MAIIQKLRSKSGLMLVVIGGSLLLFVLMDAFSNKAGGGLGSSDPNELGEVNGTIVETKDYNEYVKWLENRNTQRYVDIEGHGQQIDGKNLLHCRRLLDVAMEIPTLKTILVKRPNANELLDIRKGKVDLDTIIDKAEEDIKLLDDLYLNSSLPDKVDEEFLNDLLIQIRNL